MSFDTDGIVNLVVCQIESHMKSQPYEIICADCGKALGYKAEVDIDLDLRLEVEPCGCCKEGTTDE